MLDRVIARCPEGHNDGSRMPVTQRQRKLKRDRL
jgi:hypothetical protein